MRTIFALLAIIVLLAAKAASAEDLTQIFGRVGQYVAAKNFPKALEELGWAKKEIEKMHMGEVKNFFPDELAGLKGDKFEANSMLGFTNIERNYRNGSTTVKVSVTGGASGGAPAGFGQLAALGSMAAMMQGQGEGNETFRVAGRTANLSSEGTPELTVFLNSGSILKFELSEGSDKEFLKKMAEALKIDALDNYLRGANQ